MSDLSEIGHRPRREAGATRCRLNIAAGITSGLAGLRQADRGGASPYVRMPERVVPGEPLQLRTTLPLGGYGRGVRGAASYDGRPIKVEGNAAATRRASGPPTSSPRRMCCRSTIPTVRGDACCDGAIIGLRTQAAWAQTRADRLAGLARRTARGAPAADRPGHLADAAPADRWRCAACIPGCAGMCTTRSTTRRCRRGRRCAFGRPLDLPMPRLERAEVDVPRDAGRRPARAGPGPDRGWRAASPQIAGVRGEWRPRWRGSTPSRPCPTTLTGAKADHRWRSHAGRHRRRRRRAVAQCARGRRCPTRRCRRSLRASEAIAAVATWTEQGPSRRALVLVGRPVRSRPETHALVHWINARLQAAPLDLDRAARPDAGPAGAGTLADLVRRPGGRRRPHPGRQRLPIRSTTRRPTARLAATHGAGAGSGSTHGILPSTRRRRSATWHVPAVAPARILGRPARDRTARREPRAAADPAALRHAARSNLHECLAGRFDTAEPDTVRLRPRARHLDGRPAAARSRRLVDAGAA